MKEPIVSLRIDQDAGKTQPNPYGYEHIHIWCFNYDGAGTALVTFDEAADFESIGGIDLVHVLLGDSGSGIRWYHRVTKHESTK